MSEKYIGTKFTTVFKGDFIPNITEKKHIKALISAGHTFGEMGIKDKNGGNISTREEGGIIIKRTGAHPFELKSEDFVFVEKARGDKVYARGKFEPSSEARLHLDIYKVRPDVNCILHCHDFLGVNCPEKYSDIGYIKKQSYGTVELALEVARQAKKFDYLIEEGHGIIALGSDVKTTLLKIKKFHKRFIK
jgi:L-fuculose-phosphate aldolase